MGQVVRVHWNRHRKLWSVLARGDPARHATFLVLAGCKFVVWRGGHERYRREGVRNVHAFVKGEIVDEVGGAGVAPAIDQGVPVRYNLDAGRFESLDGKMVVASRSVVFESNGRVLAISPSYAPLA